MVSDMLLSVRTLFREFGIRSGAYVPQDCGAHQCVSLCGTATTRRYADLAIQRQVKCFLSGRGPAGRHRMDELRSWVAKRYAAGLRWGGAGERRPADTCAGEGARIGRRGGRAAWRGAAGMRRGGGRRWRARPARQVPHQLRRGGQRAAAVARRGMRGAGAAVSWTSRGRTMWMPCR